MGTREVKNLAKLLLLMDKACLALRELFEKSWKTRFGHEWSGTEGDINIMLAQKQMKNIGKLQRKAILTGDVKSWDLTTLRTILTSKDFLNLTAKEVRNINCLANIQSNLARSASKGITDDELNTHWCAASDILLELGELEADLALFKQESGVEIINKEATLEARRLKEAGNIQFQKNNWTKSIKMYTEAILLPGIPNADRATLYSNRSVAFLRQKRMSLAMEDAKKTIEIWPEWWRGHYRMGQVYTEMNEYKKAESCFDEAFAREPHQEEIMEARSYVRMKQCELDRNDTMDAYLTPQSLDDAISEFERRTTCHINPEAIKKMLHANVKDDFTKNWQDCQKGNNCLTGADGYPRDYSVAAQYYKSAADRGSAEGLCLLARLTMEGKGVKRDMQLGISMLKQAAGKPLLLNGVANTGVAESEHVLGLCYENGIGVAKDEFAAMDWYKKACEHGSVTAANNLGLIYQRKGNLVKAEQYLKMAANAGYAKAMVNLAGYYCWQRNANQALAWCRRARSSGTFGPGLDHIEKSSEDVIREFNEMGIEDWESKNEKTSTGLSMKERMQRYMCRSDPHMADCMKLMLEFAEQVTKNKGVIHGTNRFPPDQLQEAAKTSAYARELQKAQNHYFAAMSAMMALGVSNHSPMFFCEKFVTELSSCAKIEFILAVFPKEWYQQACSLVDHLLTQKTTFNEDTCICYVALNALSSLESTVTFLNECIRKYPQNVYFIKTRGNLYVFLQRYADSLRDINASIKLAPHMHECLYFRASNMRLLKLSSEVIIAAYMEFLAVAPEDHRHVPDSYYAMALVHFCRNESSGKPNLGEMVICEATRLFNLGIEAEGKQLPFFLPYESSVKSSVQLLITVASSSKLRKEQSGAGKKSNKPQVAAKPAAASSTEHEEHKPGKSTTVRQDRVFRPAISDPSRENTIKNFRIHISTLSTQLSSGLSEVLLSFKPTKVQKSARSLIGLKPITFNDMDHSQDKIYNGYVLAVTIIEGIAFMTSMQTIIQDSSGDVLPCAIYNWPNAEDQVLARKEFGIGCKISITNPYMRMAVHGQSVIRVDDPTSIIFQGFVEKMCRYCCEPNANKSCAKCKANYCDKECQKLDWKQLDHKLICGMNP